MEAAAHPVGLSAGRLHKCAAEPHWGSGGAPPPAGSGAVLGSCVSSRTGGGPAVEPAAKKEK